MRALDLITQSLFDIGYLGVGDVLSNADAQFALVKGNQWIDALTLEPLTLYYFPRTVTTLSPNVASLTIGTGGNINIVRPDKIKHAGLVIDLTASPPTEIGIDVFTDQRWQLVRQKALPSPYVNGIYYDRNDIGGLGTIFLYPVPTIANTQLVIYTLQQLTQFADLTTDYTLPPGYPLFFRSNWAVLLAPSFGRPVTPEMTGAATYAKARVKRSNNRPVELLLDSRVPGTGQGNVYDWRIDGFRPSSS